MNRRGPGTEPTRNIVASVVMVACHTVQDVLWNFIEAGEGSLGLRPNSRHENLGHYRGLSVEDGFRRTSAGSVPRAEQISSDVVSSKSYHKSISNIVYEIALILEFPTFEALLAFSRYGLLSVGVKHLVVGGALALLRTCIAELYLYAALTICLLSRKALSPSQYSAKQCEPEKLSRHKPKVLEEDSLLTHFH
jgi:hypothetical protein